MAKLLQAEEQETIIIIDRNSDTAKLYSSDTRFRNRFRKLYGDRQVKTYSQNGEVVAEEYEVDKRLVTFRSAVPKRRELTEEEKTELRERLERIREQKAV
jgi:hypothetical protein